jgi:hypothetical protein
MPKHRNTQLTDAEGRFVRQVLTAIRRLNERWVALACKKDRLVARTIDTWDVEEHLIRYEADMTQLSQKLAPYEGRY